MSNSRKDKASTSAVYRLQPQLDGASVRKAILADALAPVREATRRGSSASSEAAEWSAGRKKLGNLAAVKLAPLGSEGSPAGEAEGGSPAAAPVSDASGNASALPAPAAADRVPGLPPAVPAPAPDGASASAPAPEPGEMPHPDAANGATVACEGGVPERSADGGAAEEPAEASGAFPKRRSRANLLLAMKGPSQACEGQGEPKPTPAEAATPSKPEGVGTIGGPAYGWVEGGLPTPAGGGCYAVEFLDDEQVRVLAYIDPFGRAFATDKPSAVPPARLPDLCFEPDEHNKGRRRIEGSVLARGAAGEGDAVDVARYSCLDDAYELCDTWYAFGGHDRGLSYNDAMTRAFFAFVYRPAQGATPVPARGLGGIFDSLRSENFVRSLLAMVGHVNDAMRDPSLSVPGLVQCLVRWLDEAAGGSLRSLGLADGDLRLVRTVRYGDTFFVGNESEDNRLSASQVWAIEAALNRFLLASERLGDAAGRATVEEAQQADREVIALAATQSPVIGPLAGSPKYIDGRDFPDSEWRFRCRFAAALERMRVPFRVSVAFRSDVDAGVAALDVTLPQVEMMRSCDEVPMQAGEGEAAAAAEGESAPQAGDEATASIASEEPAPSDDAAVGGLDAASLYGLRMGLFAAVAAFRSSESVSKVHLYLHALDDESVGDGPMRSMGFMAPGDDFDALFLNQQEPDGVAVVADLHREQGVAVVALGRETFEATDGFKEARAGDPLPLYRQNGAILSKFALQGIGPFDAVRSLPSAAVRKDLPEVGREDLGPEAAKALGATNSFGVRIVYDGELRRFAEELADSIVGAASVAQAIAVVRAAQEQESQKRNEPGVSACTRLMTALAEGSVGLGDQNAIVGVCLGEDRCRLANLRADALSEQGEFDEAASLLIDAIRESAALDGFIDGSTTVFRSFDTYASRLLYNLAREGVVTGVDAVEADGGRHVELTTDSFFMAHAEVTRLLERSFQYTEQAVAYGKRLIELSPTVALGYRVLGRAYMLTGDMESARKTLVAGLKTALVAGDISALYYQLAYVLWKMGKPEVGAAAYAKCLEISPVVASQAQAELEELLEEASMPAPEPARVDRTLRQGGVPVAPRPCLLNEIDKAVVAAVQENLFPVARGLLAVRLRYRPDDALSNVLRSLGD